MNWSAFNDGKSIGQRGSENGTIMRDEEHRDGARITLERDGQTAPFAITCGIYGWTVHTRFIGTEFEAQADFDGMKSELNEIVASIPLTTDPEVDSKSQKVSESISACVRKFP